MGNHYSNNLSIVANKINQAKSVFILTGAGISKESGIPTFREPDGFWAQHSIEDLATPYGFNRNPKLVWEWYEMRRQMCLQAEPNAGHYALVELESLLINRNAQFLLATQNIDGLHSRAGSSSEYLFELHGSINQCRSVNFINYPIPSDEIKTIPFTGFDELPPFDDHGNMLRPHIVWFTEQLDPFHIEKCYQFTETCDVCLSIGTMGAVFPAAEFPILAKQNGAFTVEVNPNITEISNYMDVMINTSAAFALPLLLEWIKSN